MQLDQYGMEYNPVAINEAIAYPVSIRIFTAAGGTPTSLNRFFIELVNTLTQSASRPAAARRYQPARPEHPRPGRVPVHAGGPLFRRLLGPGLHRRHAQ